ncbi:hypothetical protein [Streptomyces sp. NBC_00623]|uniref:hypothetical protein n=1 Tax=Streptomyces sp. NBC_00623 TaxID=2975790 RepID=UPI0030E4BF48
MGQGIVIGGRRIESGSGLDPDLRDRDDRTTVLTASLAVERPAVPIVAQSALAPMGE